MDQEVDHLIQFKVLGPIGQDERGYDRRQTLLELEMQTTAAHVGYVASTVLELLSRRGAALGQDTEQ